ncbi:MAG: hypothetical protein ACYC63_13270 [Armatimonadota bacterium]
MISSRHTLRMPLEGPDIIRPAVGARAYRGRMVSGLSITILMFFIASSALAVGSINAAIDKPQITVGEPLTYTVTLIIPQGATAKLPAEKAKFKLFEVRDYKPTQTTLPDSSQQIVLQYTLVCFDVGTRGIKDFKVPVTVPGAQPETYLAPPLDIKVASVLPANGKAEPKGFYGPIKMPAWWADWLVPAAIALAIFALAAGVIWFLRRRKKQVAEEAPEIILAPDQAALGALDRLQKDDLVANGQFLIFYQRLDETLRAWLQARFDLPALERTRLGITYLLRVRRESDPWRTQYLELLKAGDRVKYANLLPSDDEARAHLDRAREVIALARPAEPVNDAAPDDDNEPEAMTP